MALARGRRVPSRTGHATEEGRMSTHLSGAQLEGRTVYASDGEKLGKVDSVLEDDTGTAQYVEVKTGWFGSRRHTIPVHGLTESGDDLTSAYTKEQLESAPTFDEGEEIDYDRERAIGSHYGTDTREWDDRRDAWLAGEDLSRGPTPETRHPAGYVEGRDLAEDDSRRGETGGLDDVRDTTQGPTPETRQAMRLTDDDSAAAGQPSADGAPAATSAATRTGTSSSRTATATSSSPPAPGRGRATTPPARPPTRR